MKKMQFVELSVEEYDGYVAHHEQANFLSSIYQYKLKSRAGYEVYLLGVKEDTKIMGAAFIIGSALLHRFRYFYAPRGPILDYHNKELLTFFMHHLQVFLKAKKGLYLKVDPYVFYQEHDCDGGIVKDGFYNQDCVDNLLSLGAKHSGFTKGFDDAKQVRWMMTLLLKNQDEQSLIDQMDQLRKRIIKKLSKSEYVKVRELSRDELPLFEEIVEVTSRRKGFYNRELLYYTSLYDSFHSNHAKAVIAYVDLLAYQSWACKQVQEEEQKLLVLKEKETTEKNKTKIKTCETSMLVYQKHMEKGAELQAEHGDTLVLSTAFFLLYGNEVLYLSGGSFQERNAFNGPYAIQWYMIKMALAQGYPRYNFYGTSGDFTKNADDYGVFEFKRGFHAKAEELLGDFYLPLRPMMFSLYNKIKHVV